MATPARLVELQCPNCQAIHWEIDNDFRGSSLVGRPELSYVQRTYHCPGCQTQSVGYRVLRKAPPEFFLQPHGLYPMTTPDFAHWLAIFKTHLPLDDRHKSLGVSWYPGEHDDQQDQKLSAARRIASSRYQIDLVNRGPEDDCIRLCVQALGRQGFGEAYFNCRPEVELDPSFTTLDPDELEQIRQQLTTMTPAIQSAWERFAQAALEAQARWLPKLLKSEGT